MRLVDNWREVLRYAWSLRLLAFAGILAGLQEALPLISTFVPIPPGLLTLLTVVTIAAAFVARFVAQQSITNKGASDAGQSAPPDQPR
jgi:putative flippase GtrA